MLLQNVAFAELDNKLFKFRRNRFREDKVIQPGLRIRSTNDRSQLAPRLGNQCWRRWLRLRGLARFDPLPKLFGETRVALLLFRGGKLKREIEESFFVPLHVTLHESNELLRSGHQICLPVKAYLSLFNGNC